MDYPWQVKISNSHTTRTTTNTQPQYTTTTSGKRGAQLTLDQFEQTTSQTTESSVRDSPVHHSHKQDSNKDSGTPEANSFLTLNELPGLNSLNTYSWKTLQDYCDATKGESSHESSIRFGTVGMWDHGAVSTARHSCPNPGRECTLLHVLETNPPERYYLSRTAIESHIRYAIRSRRKHQGFGATLLTPYKRETIRVVQCNISSNPDITNGG